MVKLQIALSFLRAYLQNRYAEWRNDRLENKKRRWSAHKIGGGGVLPLGKVNQSAALQKVSIFGSVAFVDTTVAIIFYHDKNS